MSVATARSTFLHTFQYCTVLYDKTHDVKMTAFIYLLPHPREHPSAPYLIQQHCATEGYDSLYLVNKVGDGCLVGRDIICCRTTTVEIRHGVSRGIICHARRCNSVALSVPKEPASSAHRTNHVDKLAITCHVDLRVSLKLAENPIPSGTTVTFAFVYNRRVRHKWGERIAGDKEVDVFPSAGPDFGADRARCSIGGEPLV